MAEKYDAELLELAKKSVEGAGDGRISVVDAKELSKAVIDGNQYTDTEKAIIEYIHTNFNGRMRQLLGLKAKLIRGKSLNKYIIMFPISDNRDQLFGLYYFMYIVFS